ncbi:probable disease resistance protein At5g66900 [Macadamia integrifolia]|uniref:probable disease resistance protein At5g66900 n=1 Tax=Macadamia integrifolia TaxID=60698 RepID=UPI001C52D002|nr:probable disease resistance protein At5g66900 [Macadamia integrifolia]
MVQDRFSRWAKNKSTNNNVKSELDQYLGEPRKSYEKDYDVLAYWKSCQAQYPDLSRLARDILAIPVSTVASESAFSAGGRVLDKYRNRLIPKNVEALVIVFYLYIAEEDEEELFEALEDVFKNIFFLTVSSSPDFKVIVQKLLGQIFPTNPVPHFLSEEEAIMKLGNLMTQIATESTLLVLDDDWEDSVVRKFVFGAVKYKILVTSRTQYQAFDNKYSLKMLDDADAISLFHHSVFPQNGNVKYEEPDRELQMKIVRGCKGFPMALKVIWSLIASAACQGVATKREDVVNLEYLNEEVQECFTELGSLLKMKESLLHLLQIYRLNFME